MIVVPDDADAREQAETAERMVEVGRSDAER